MPSTHVRHSPAWTAAVAVASVSLVIAAATLVRGVHADATPPPEPTLVASLRAEPRSFNRYVARDLSTVVLTLLLHDSLVRVDRATNELEPALAERWQLLGDRRTFRLTLRRGVRFSDGAPFTADDVVFSFAAIYDAAVDSVLADTLQIGGRPLAVTAEDASTVTIRFPAPFGPGLRMLDGVPIYPRHRLQAALEAGRFRSAWGVSADPREIAGLGPFVLRRYDPGQRLVLDRNPEYWRRPQPSVGHVTLPIVPDQDAELLQLQAGDIDLTQSGLRPVDVAALRHATASGRVSIANAGIALDGDLLWLNLAPARARDPRSRWLQHPDFRRAIAHAVDRRLFVDTVYLGQAVPADSIVSPGNREWHVAAPAPDYDLERAGQLLASLGLSTRRGESMRQDSDGRAVRFTLLTQKGNTSLERGAAVIRGSLAQLGVRVDVVALEVGALMNAVMRGDYDAAYFRLLTTDTDPALNGDFWLSSGSAHIWNPGQRRPATFWESDIDALMSRVATSADAAERREAFARVQRIMAREVPVVCFAFPKLAVAFGARVDHAVPVAFEPPVLWRPEALSVHAR